MSLIFDEFGRPFLILRDQDKKKRTKGLEAHKVIPTHSPTGKHPGRKDCCQSFENIFGTKGNGQDAHFSRRRSGGHQ